jgi:ketopantoate reductase
MLLYESGANGYDLADYLINQQAEINELNEVYDAYNSKLEMVLNDESLKQDFNSILGEQKAIAMYNGGLSENEVERICRQPENMRSVVMSVEKREKPTVVGTLTWSVTKKGQENLLDFPVLK